MESTLTLEELAAQLVTLLGRQMGHTPTNITAVRVRDTGPNNFRTVVLTPAETEEKK